MASKSVKKHNIEMAALGRQFQLGNFYDYRTDTIVGGPNTLGWDQAVTAEMAEVDNDFKLKVVCPDSEATKWDHMKLEDHMRASVLAGLIDKYRGASNYVNEKEQPNEVTQVLVYRAKTRKEMLDVDELIKEHAVRLPNSGSSSKKQKVEATHVVVGIVYGIEAYCVLTQDLKKSKSKKKTKKSKKDDDDDDDDEDSEEDGRDNKAKSNAEDALMGVAEKMQSGLKDNQPVNDFKEEFDKKEMRELMRTKYRLYSDTRSQSFRECNVFDAYKECLAMTQLVQKSEETKGGSKEVPIKVILCPLNAIAEASGSSDYFHDVDSDLLTRCFELCSKLDEVTAKAETMRSSLKKGNRQSLTRFIKTVDKYREMLRNGLKEAVVTARKDDDDEQVETLIEMAEKHKLFKPSRLKRWLKFKDAEIQWMSNINNTFGFPIVTAKNLADELSDSFEKKHALVLSIPSPEEKTNAMLSNMKDHLSSYKKLVSARKRGDSDDDDDDDDEDEDDDDDDRDNSSSDDEDNNEAENEDNLPWPMVDRKQRPIVAKIKQLANFRDRNKSLEEKVHYIVASADSPTKNCFYSVYEMERKLNTSPMADPPGRPTGLKVDARNGSNSKKASTAISWDYPNSGYPCHFVIEYRKKGDPDAKWVQQRTTKSGETKATLTTKHADLPLEIRVAADTCVGRSEFSDILDTETDSSDDSEGENGSADDDDDAPSSHSRRTTSSEEKEFKSGIASAASAHNKPIAAVRSKLNQSSNRTRDQSITTPTEKLRFAEMIIEHCKKIGSRNDMDLYGVPLKMSKLSNPSVRRFTFEFGGRGKGVASQKSAQRRTLLVMGATGAGKTTLINGMINYIFDVQWEDTFRFELIQESLVGRSQANSQTSQITAYDINYCDGFRIPYSLTIVDTPGYGDTKGLKRDQEITQMVRQFFEDKAGIQEVDVVGFVAQASLPRLTPTQMYIFDSVLQIFGNDIKENINFLLTFADSQNPPVLSAISEAHLPCPTDEDGQPLHHKFNNSGFFCSSRQPSAASINTVDKFNNFFWKMGMKNFQNFFNVLATMKTKSLSLTRKVLEERKKLEATVEGLQPLIKIGLAKMEELRKTKTMIANSQAQIEANENVEFEVEVTKPTKIEIPRGQHLTNCNKCYVTCHNPCGIPNDDGKKECWAMNFSMPAETRCCRICPEKCIWNMHSNQPYRWEYVTEKTLTSSDAIKAKYEGELNKKLTTEQLVKVLEQDLKQNEADVLKKVDTVANCIKRLEEIALRPNPFSTPQYIDLIIDAEQQEKKPGYQQRIESLKELRQMAVITTKVKNKESLLSFDRKDDLDDVESMNDDATTAYARDDDDYSSSGRSFQNDDDDDD